MDALYKKIMAVRRPVVFRAKKRCFGWVYPEINDSPIHINLKRHKRGDPVETYAHECIHVIYPTMPEAEVRKLTAKLWKSLTSHQRFLLSKKLYNRKWNTDEGG